MPQNTFAAVALSIVIFTSGYVFGYFTADKADEVIEDTSEVVGSAAATMTDGGGNEEYAAVANPEAVAFTINLSDVPESQRSFLRTMGIEGNEINVTNRMLACAQAKVGTERMVEIENGAVPSMSEGVQLMSCYE